MQWDGALVWLAIVLDGQLFIPWTVFSVLKLEMVQRQATRFVSNNYNRIANVTKMLHHLKRDTLEARRNNLRIMLLHKIINKLVDISLEKQLVLTNSITRGHSQRYLQLLTKLMLINIPFSRFY